MVKIVYVIKRKAVMSVEEFQTYWFETHGPIAGAIPGVRRYVQCHTLPEFYGDSDEPAFDGAAELWFDSLEAMEEAFQTDEIAAARESELKFMDHSKSFRIVTEEKTVID